MGLFRLGNLGKAQMFHKVNNVAEICQAAESPVKWPFATSRRQWG